MIGAGLCNYCNCMEVGVVCSDNICLCDDGSMVDSSLCLVLLCEMVKCVVYFNV